MQDGLGAVQSVLVLGGASDIAGATLRQLVGQRTRTVVLASRDPHANDDLAEELRTLGATSVESIVFDANELGTHAAFVDDVFSRGDDIDLVLLTFGILGDQEVAERDSQAAAEIARVNYVAAISVLIPVAQRLQTQGHGVLVALSSVAGERARRSNFVYGSSKAGLDAFLQGLGDSLVGTGVHVMIVRPGFVHTKMTAGLQAAPLAVTPDDVAAAIVEGIEARREIVWVPPQLRYVMSFLRHVPRSVFRKLPL